MISAISSRISQAKNNSRGKQLPEMNLTVDYLYDLFKQQDGRCALSFIELRIEKEHLATLSLDKIIPAKGYTQGNVQWTAWAVNRAKGEMPMDDFILMCQHVLEYQKEQRLSKGVV